MVQITDGLEWITLTALELSPSPLIAAILSPLETEVCSEKKILLEFIFKEFLLTLKVKRSHSHSHLKLRIRPLRTFPRRVER